MVRGEKNIVIRIDCDHISFALKVHVLFQPELLHDRSDQRGRATTRGGCAIQFT